MSRKVTSFVPIVFLITYILLLTSGCESQSGHTQRIGKSILMVGNNIVLSNLSEDPIWLALHQTCSVRSIPLDTLSASNQLTEDLLSKYSALIFFGGSPSIYPPHIQTAVARYVQAGSGLISINTQAPKVLSWPWYKKLFDTFNTGQFNSFQQTISNKQRHAFLQTDSSFAATDLFFRELEKQLDFVIGDNSYDKCKVTSIAAPHPNRFNKEVLDHDINEPMENGYSAQW